MLCLPGGLATAPFYDDVLAEPPWRPTVCARSRRRCPASAASPSHLGFDASVEAYAAFAGNLARDLGCHAVVGHSFGANVAIEMAVGGHFGGHLILLAPTFSAEDEMRGLATFNRIGYVPGLRSLVTALLFRSLQKMLKGEVPPDRVDRLAAEMASNDRAATRLTLRRSFEYLYRHGTIAGRLCRPGVRAEVVIGEKD